MGRPDVNQVNQYVSCKPGASRELDLRPQGMRSNKCSKLIFGNIIVVVGHSSSENDQEGM